MKCVLCRCSVLCVLTNTHSQVGFPSGSVVKNLPASAGDAGDSGAIPGSRRSPGVGNGNPFQYSWLGSPVGRGAWRVTLQGLQRIWQQLSDMHAPEWWGSAVSPARTPTGSEQTTFSPGSFLRTLGMGWTEFLLEFPLSFGIPRGYQVLMAEGAYLYRAWHALGNLHLNECKSRDWGRTEDM